MMSEGRRVQQLRKAFKTALDRTFRQYSKEQLTVFFPNDLLVSHGTTIEDFCAQTIHIVKRNVVAEFDIILKEVDIVEKLNTLDQLERQQPLLPNGQRVPLVAIADPRVLIRKHIKAVRQAQLEKLEATVAALESENAQLRADLVPKRQKIVSARREIEQRVAAVRSAVSATQKVVQGQKQGQRFESSAIQPLRSNPDYLNRGMMS